MPGTSPGMTARAVDESHQLRVGIMPPGGIDGLSWDQRAALIDNLEMQLAATTYRLRGDIRPLQVQTLRFLQRAVDKAYEEAISALAKGRLQVRLSTQEAIGSYIDANVRTALRNTLTYYKISFRSNSEVMVNSRDYATSADGRTYRIPDARLGGVSYDWTLSSKSETTPQIRGYFAADSEPWGVIIIRPTQLGADSACLIPRTQKNSR